LLSAPDPASLSSGQPSAEQESGRESAAVAVAVDGKTLRGAIQADGRAAHLLAAMIHSEGVVLAQREVGHKTNEITQVRPLLDPLDLADAVITLDAMHCQRETARYLVEDKGADYIFTAVKDNQPSLFTALDGLPWDSVPVQDAMTGRKHGRDEIRTIQVLPAPHGLFPHAAQAFLIERYVAGLRGSPKSAAAALGITSLTAQRADPAQIAMHVRGHWRIENNLHWVRDLDWDEDRSQVRRGSAPRFSPDCATSRSEHCTPPGGPRSQQASAGSPATRHAY
jgi:predicted transposase YbfD/YdcC